MIFWLVCLAAVPLSGVSSQSLLDAFLILLFGGWVYQFIKEKKLNLATKPDCIGIEWAFLAYFGVACLGFYINREAAPPYIHALLKFTWVLHLYILIHAFKQVKIEKIKVIKYFALAYVLPTVYSIVGYLRGQDIITGRENSRLTGLLNSSTYHAHGNAVVLVFNAALVFLFWNKLTTKWKIVATTCLVLMGISIIFTFTRGIWLSIFISTICMLGLYNIRQALKFIIASLSLVGVTYLTWQKFADRVNTLFMASGGDPGRTNLFKVNVQIWKEHPWLGIGYGENARRVHEYWVRPEWNLPANYFSSHAHNQFLNVLSTTGIVGLFFFLCFWIYFLSLNWRMLQKANFQKEPFHYALIFASLWAQLEFTLGCLTDVSFEYAKVRAMLLVVWALIIAIRKKPNIVVEES